MEDNKEKNIINSPISNGVKKFGNFGFTLVEMIVVMVIMAALLTFSIANFRQGEKSAQLADAERQILDDIRLMQTRALAGKTVNACRHIDGEGKISFYKFCSLDGDCNSGDNCIETVPPGGYGINILTCLQSSTECRYKLFADLNNDGFLNSDIPNNINEQLSDGDKLLAKDVKVNTITLDSVGKSSIFIRFYPYSTKVGVFPTISGGGSGSGGSQVEANKIIIRLTDWKINKSTNFSVDRWSGEVSDK